MRRLLILMLLFACGERSQFDDDDDAGVLPPPTDSGPRPDAGFIPDMVLARFIIDGDTLIVSAGSHLKTPDNKPLNDETIRLIGVDAPEIEHPPAPADCYGDEAKAFTEAEIGGRTVELTYDTTHPVRDQFMRLLAYVTRNGQVHNERLISTGNARAFRGFPHPQLGHYIDLEEQAEAQNLGLWACP